MANQLKEELVLSTSKFDSNINNVIKKVEELKNKGSKVGGGFDSSMGKMIEKATGFNGSLGSLIGVVGKFSGALGVAMSAGELFNTMMNQSQTLGDAVTKVQNQASEAVNYFASSLASADFNGFLDGLRNIISLAGEAADAMDRAASIGLRFGWTNQSQLGSYNRAMAEARNPENTKEQRLKYLEEAKRISKQITKSENIKSQADIDTAFKTIRTELSKIKYNGKHVDANRLTDKEIADCVDYFLAATQRGAALVSPKISKGEKAVLNAVFKAKLPLIVLQENGFTDPDKLRCQIQIARGRKGY